MSAGGESSQPDQLVLIMSAGGASSQPDQLVLPMSAGDASSLLMVCSADERRHKRNKLSCDENKISARFGAMGKKVSLSIYN